MAQHCLICNNKSLTARNAFNIFDELASSKDDESATYILQSSKKLFELVSNIIGIQLEDKKVHSNKICKKCHKSCLEYDKIQTRLAALKAEILTQFKNSIKSHNLNYEDYVKACAVKNNVSPTAQKQPGKKLVLPASKLQPLPPDLMLKVGKIQCLPKGNIVMPQLKTANASTLNLKVTVGSSVLTQTIKTTTASNAGVKQKHTPAILTSLSKSFREEIESKIGSQTQVKRETDNLELSMNSFLTEAIMSKVGDDKSDDNINDQSMEIDEDCSVSLIPVSSADSKNLVLELEEIKSTCKESPTEWNVEELESLDGSNDEQYILGKVQMLDEAEDGMDEDEESHTIVVDSENGSILRVVSGQKFVYEGGEISLVISDEDRHQDDSNGPTDEQADDSNEETAIELQMAGDEETANAILAAAQEQGGAFIKVESGEMFRVQTVDQRLPNLVAKKGDGFQCLLCDNKNDSDKTSVMGDAEYMMRHLKRFHDARLYICKFCSAIMRKKVEYTAHIAEHATKIKSGRGAHACGSCGKAFGSRVLLAEHANVHAGLRPHRCELCHKAFASKYTYQAHVKTHANRPRPYKCTQCEKTFLTQQHLNQHEKTHLGVKDFVCNVCNKAFSTQHNLEVHGVVHSGNKPFRCTTCPKAFARRAELRDHARTHTGERPYPCEVCGARFTQRSNLHSHRRATHMDDKRHHCSLCPKRFKRRRLLEYHIKSSHTGERPLKCEVCTASFVYPEHYKKHIRIHSGDRPYVCEICGKSFNSPDNRNTHRFVHSDKKPYECVACGAGYMRKQLLYAHMNTSGHLAESIVVNLPRVIKATDNVPEATAEIQQTQSQPISKFDAIFETNEIESNVKPIISAEKATLSLLQTGGDPTLLTIHNLGDSDQGTILETIDADQLTGQAEIVANDENGGVVRLIQIKLADGNNGWVALNRE